MTTGADARSAAVGALLGAFVGDALGMPYESKPGDAIPESIEMSEGRAAAGTYTDDTQMMIALAESLLRCNRVDEQDLARTFRAHYDPRRGYGSGTRKVMELWDQGVDVAEAAKQTFGGTGSRRNGAAMRVAPVAVRFFQEQDKLVEQARRSAVVTHAHAEGVDGAIVQAVAVAAALAGQNPLARAAAVAGTPALRNRIAALERLTAESLDPHELGGPDWSVASLAEASVPVAVAVASRARSFEEAVTIAVRCGGDTDTVAAMAGAIAGARFGASAIPRRWDSALEDGERGRSHVERLAIELLAQAEAEAI